MRRTVEGAFGGRRPKADLCSLPLRNGSDRNHCARNHSAIEEKLNGRARPDVRPMISVFELFKISIGPSSSRSSWPMKDTGRFRDCILADSELGSVASLRVSLCGSLA